MYASHVITGACMQIQESIKEGGGGYSTSTYTSRGSGGMLQKLLCHERAPGAN